MLYVTTRDKYDAFTSHRALTQNCGPDGGFFRPFRLPKLEPQEIAAMAEKSFGQNVATIMNLFFSSKLTGWDVAFCIGRNAVKLVPMHYRTWSVESWHGQTETFHWITQQLISRIYGSQCPVTDWSVIAVRIGVLFAAYGELLKTGAAEPEKSMDVAMMTGDFTAPMAAWYAREMGLPVGTIICGCNENSGLWDLVYHGQLHTDGVAVDTGMPETDYVVPPALERLIFETCGIDETNRYLDICRRGRLYTLDEENVEQLHKGMFVAVVTKKRMADIILNVNRTNSYLMGPEAALAFGGLQDYRAKTGEIRPALILSDGNPRRAADLISGILKMTKSEFLSKMT